MQTHTHKKTLGRRASEGTGSYVHPTRLTSGHTRPAPAAPGQGSAPRRRASQRGSVSKRTDQILLLTQPLKRQLHSGPHTRFPKVLPARARGELPCPIPRAGPREQARKPRAQSRGARAPAAPHLAPRTRLRRARDPRTPVWGSLLAASPHFCSQTLLPAAPAGAPDLGESCSRAVEGRHRLLATLLATG